MQALSGLRRAAVHASQHILGLLEKLLRQQQSDIVRIVQGSSACSRAQHSGRQLEQVHARQSLLKDRQDLPLPEHWGQGPMWTTCEHVQQIWAKSKFSSWRVPKTVMQAWAERIVEVGHRS